MKKPKILIVEDEFISAMNLKNELLAHGYDVLDVETTGEGAIKSVELNNPDLILMDVVLIGRMNGIEAATEIVDRNKLPIIFMTGMDDRLSRASSEYIQPIGYFVKPVDFKELEIIIRATLMS